MRVTRFAVSGSRLTLFLKLYRFLDRDSFVEAIAPKDDLTKIGRAQFAILFKVADSSKRGLISWDDFAVFQTILKRPDADYWIAFQYFDVYAEPNVIYTFTSSIIALEMNLGLSHSTNLRMFSPRI